MAEFNFSVIHLGNIADFDPTDGNAAAENQSALLGTYRGGADPASGHITTLIAQDTNNDELIDTNDTLSAEAVSFDLGNGQVNTFYDSLFNVDATVNFGAESGEPPYNGLGGVIQTETGDLFFVMIDDDTGLGANSLDNFSIDSIVINSISGFGVQQNATASDDQAFVPCFTTGTRIETRRGLVPVELLKVGDEVKTRDNGYQAIRWIGRKFLSAHRLAQYPKLRAIQISAGALGNGCPSQDLMVSPQHRVLLNSKITKRMTDESEVLVAAIKLVGFPGIQQLDCRLGIQYHHFACSTHQLVWANAALAETLFLGPQVKQGINDAAREELEIALPQAFATEMAKNNKPVRPIIQRQSFIKNMLARHIKNDMTLVNMDAVCVVNTAQLEQTGKPHPRM